MDVKVDDLELLNRYTRERSEQAFSELVARYAGMVYKSANRQLRDSHLAEDVTQAVFILLARKASKLDSSTHLPSWLWRTTQYACANARRMVKRRREVSVEAANMLNADQSRASSEDISP